MAKDIKAFSLINGSDVLGNVVEETETTYVLEAVMLFRILPPQAQGENPRPTLLPPTAISHISEKGGTGESMILHKHAVCFSDIAIPNDLMKDYVQSTSSIIMPGNSTNPQGFVATKG